MAAEIVLHQDDLADPRKVVVIQSLEYLRIVDSGAAVGDLDVSLSTLADRPLRCMSKVLFARWPDAGSAGALSVNATILIYRKK
jgi:hypothetical protein